MGNPCAPHPLNKSCSTFSTVQLEKSTIIHAYTSVDYELQFVIHACKMYNVMYVYVCIASSPSPFPAFQCCTLFLRNIKKLGGGPGARDKAEANVCIHVQVLYLFTWHEFDPDV